MPEYNLARVRVFTASARKEPGKEMGRFLLSKGHRHLAYLSPFHAEAWSVNRCAGVRRIVDLAGSGFTLREFTLNQSGKGDDFFRAGRAMCNGAILERQYASWMRRTDPPFFWDTGEMASTGLPLLLWSLGTRSALYSLLDKALECKEITAWVAANDIVARMAYEYCFEKGISVPGTVSIAGFDDTMAATTFRITSYSFNFGAVANAILNFLLHPMGQFWSRRRILEIAGKVVQRETA
jgi:DNA-binding LacI/PurR family transcriptional regulator